MHKRGSRTQKRFLIIGQALPEKPTAIPFERTRLFAWLETIGIEKTAALNYFAFTALVSHFPGRSGRSHRVPTKREILDDRSRVLSLLDAVNPAVVVPVGALAIREILGDDTLHLQAVIGRRFRTRPFGIGRREISVIPLPHPSGASAWIHMNGNGMLLKKALRLLGEEMLGFKAVSLDAHIASTRLGGERGDRRDSANERLRRKPINF